MKGDGGTRPARGRPPGRAGERPARQKAAAPRWNARRRRWALGVLIVFGLVLLLARLDPQLSIIGDNAQYIVLAKSLLAGKGLCHLNDPLLRPHTKYPPLYPALLVPLVGLFPGKVIPLKLLSIAAGLLALWFAFLLVESRAGPGLATLVGLLMAANATFLTYSQEVLAEIPYMAISLGALLLLDRRDRCQSAGLPAGRIALFSLLMVGAAYYTRTAGLALGVAAGAVFWLRREFRWGAIYWGGFALLAFPLYLRNRLLGTEGIYIQQLLQKNPYTPAEGTIGWGDFFARIGDNVRIYVGTVLPSLVFSRLEGVRHTPIVVAFLWVMGLLLTALVVVGFSRRLARGVTAVELYLICFGGVCLVWPPIWSSVRFLLPVLPILLFYLLEGGRDVLRWGGARWPAWGSARLAVALGAGLLAVQLVSAVQVIREPRGYWPEWQTYFAAADWVKRETPPESVVVCRSPFLFYLRADRQTVVYPFTTDTEEFYRFMAENRVTHVVVDCFRWTGTTYRYLRPALESRAEAFDVVYKTAEPSTYVLRFVERQPEGSP